MAKKRARRKARRKPRYPAGFDPSQADKFPAPDPERWLPKHLRKANQKKGSRGAQGGGEIDDMKGGAKIHHVAPEPAKAKQNNQKKGGGGGGGKKKASKKKRR